MSWLSWRSDYYRSARLCVPPRRRTRFTSIRSPVVCSTFFLLLLYIYLFLISNKFFIGIISIVDGVCSWLVNVIFIYPISFPVLVEPACNCTTRATLWVSLIYGVVFVRSSYFQCCTVCVLNTIRFLNIYEMLIFILIIFILSKLRDKSKSLCKIWPRAFVIVHVYYVFKIVLCLLSVWKMLFDVYLNMILYWTP